MSLVKRLVSRWHKEFTGKGEQDEARWWLTAIADELERLSHSKELGVARSGGVGYAAKWLRAQGAKGDSE